MATTTLGTPFTDDAVRAVNFFNGRLLTAGDLSREQEARRLADARLGGGLGPGIAWGLEVERVDGTPIGRVRLRPGLAVAASGQVLHVGSEVTVQLIPPPVAADGSSGGGAFGPCGPLPGAPYVAGDALYLLTLAPTTQAEGKAPVLALDPVNARCSVDAYVEAAQLRMLPIPDPDGRLNVAAAAGRLRNVLAYAFLAPAGQATAHAQPGWPAAESLLSQVAGLTECDVPLAVLQMVGSGVAFVDRWAVRRRLGAAAAATRTGADYAAWLGERVLAQREACFLQFQEQLGDDPDLARQPAAQKLEWLPPAGVLPPGADWQAFLGARAPEAAMDLAPSDAPDVLAAALRGDAVSLPGAPPSVRYRVYRIGGSAGPRLFVRDARNVHAAQQVWLDGARAGLPDVADVQAAVERLAGWHELTLWPGMPDLAGRIARLPKGRDARLFFEPGDYALAAPLELRDLGEVRVRGAGARLRCAELECALRIVGCRSATVDEIGFEGGASGSGKDSLGMGLLGALTVVDTPLVRVTRVQAACANGKALGAAAIVVGIREEQMEKMPRARLEVRDCTLEVGAGQQGLLCVNGEITVVRGLHVTARDKAMERGVVVGGSRAGRVTIEDNVVLDVVCGISVGLSESGDRKAAPLTAGHVTVRDNRVDLRLAGVERGDRYGLFVGNADAVQASGNQVRLLDGDAMKLEVQGLRLAGSYGPQVVVERNLFEHVHTGISFQVKGRPPQFVWAFQFNAGWGIGSAVLDVTPPVNGLVDQHNRKVLQLAPPPPR